VEQSPVCQHNRIGKLRGGQITDTDASDEAGYSAQSRGRVVHGRKQSNWLA
jgi:hypothetical protein